MAVTYARFRHGNPIMVDHVASGAINAGDVILVGDEVRVAHTDIADTKLGALGAGGGVYQMPKRTTAGSAIAAGRRVFWDASAHVITETAGSNLIFGRTIKASLDADAWQDVLHDPAGTEAT